MSRANQRRISFLGALSRVINPTSLLGVHIQNDGMQCTAAQLFNLRSDRLRHGHSASDTGACDRKHPIAREKASSDVMQPLIIGSGLGVGHVNKIVMHKLQTTVDAWVGYGSKRQNGMVWLYSAQVMFLLLI